MTLATSIAHPFHVGQRVRHDGRRYSLEPFATVLEVKPQHDGTFEYRVRVDDDAGWLWNFDNPAHETWWASYHTVGVPHPTSTEVRP